MGCLLFALALAAPRLVMALIFLFTGWFGAAFHTWSIPLLGFIFAPYTALAYMAAMLNSGAVTPAWGIVIVLAVLVDLGHWGGGYRGRRTIRGRRRGRKVRR